MLYTIFGQITKLLMDNIFFLYNCFIYIAEKYFIYWNSIIAKNLKPSNYITSSYPMCSLSWKIHFDANPLISLSMKSERRFTTHLWRLICLYIFACLLFFQRKWKMMLLRSEKPSSGLPVRLTNKNHTRIGQEWWWSVSREMYYR